MGLFKDFNYKNITKAGFTLTEIVVVLSIISILAGGTFYIAQGARARAKVARAKNELSLYGTAIRQYHSTHLLDYDLKDRWPTDVRPGGVSPTSGICSSDKIPVPKELWDAGLIQNDPCRYFDYENWPKPSGLSAGDNFYDPYHVVGITWNGLNNQRFDGNTSDNILFVVQGGEHLCESGESECLYESDYRSALPKEVIK